MITRTRKRLPRRLRRGFSLVELLAVVLILAVLAGVAVPLYINSRKNAAARTCKANIATIAAAQSAYATRFGTYCLDASGSFATETTYVAAATSGAAPATAGLVGAPEGLAQNLVCPLKGAHYTCTAGSPAGVEIQCGDKADHAIDTGAAATSWDITLHPAGNDNTNPL